MGPTDYKSCVLTTRPRHLCPRVWEQRISSPWPSPPITVSLLFVCLASTNNKLSGKCTKHAYDLLITKLVKEVTCLSFFNFGIWKTIINLDTNISKRYTEQYSMYIYNNKEYAIWLYYFTCNTRLSPYLPWHSGLKQMNSVTVYIHVCFRLCLCLYTWLVCVNFFRLFLAWRFVATWKCNSIINLNN